MPEEKDGGIWDFLFGRGALKKAAGDTKKVAPKIPAEGTGDPDFLKKQVETSTNKPKPETDALKVLAAPPKPKKSLSNPH